MEFISYMFPQGLRVLAVDESFVCLKTIETLLKECRYQVTTATSAEFALDLLRKNKEIFDIVITDIETGEMNGFRLSEIIFLEMDIPVLMMCKGSDRETMMKCLDHGACGCLMKPPTLKEIQDIWHYALKHKKNKSTLSDLDIQQNERDRNLNRNEEASHRTRVSWKDPELHAKFVEAYHKLGDEATPSRIVIEMNVPGITRQQVASHLQKYRNTLENTAFYGMSGHLRNSVFPTLEKIQFINRMKKYLSGLKSHHRGTNQLSHHGVTPNISNHSFENPQPHFLSSTQQYRSQFSSAPGTINQNYRNIQVPDSTMQNSHNQTYASGLNTDYKTNIGSRASNLLKETPNVLPNNIPFDNPANHPPVTDHTSSGIQNIYAFNMTRPTLSGYNELRNMVAPAARPNTTNVMQSQRVDQISWLANPQAFQETDNVNHHLGGCSEGDKASSVIRPYQRQ
ncbi:hypothetical protein MKW98_019777 [Papaver atlanticum]|uniref:Two-component response regulator n=1 Tax=Papaver atlanticum TaxID=357466 RepID=A0AAD4XW84_9MAGN|nr:hypothetical protein MKW98_019777 [Papaver atlanticum]